MVSWLLVWRNKEERAAIRITFRFEEIKKAEPHLGPCEKDPVWGHLRFYARGPEGMKRSQEKQTRVTTKCLEVTKGVNNQLEGSIIIKGAADEDLHNEGGVRSQEDPTVRPHERGPLM